MQNSYILLTVSMLLMIVPPTLGMDDELEADVEHLIAVGDFMHEDILAKRERVIAQGERLYPIIRQKLSDTSDSMAISRLLSMAAEAPGDKSKILPAIRDVARSEAASKDSMILVYVALTLGRIGGEADVSVLLELFRHDEERVRINAARALGQVAGLQTIPQVEEILQNRAANLSGEQIRKDYSFLEGYLAIAHIQHRALVESLERQ